MNVSLTQNNLPKCSPTSTGKLESLSCISSVGAHSTTPKNKSSTRVLSCLRRGAMHSHSSIVSDANLDKLVQIKRQLNFNSSEEISRDSGYDSSGNHSFNRDSSESTSESHRSSPVNDTLHCKWHKCTDTIDSENALYSHLLHKHLTPIKESHEQAEVVKAARGRSNRPSRCNSLPFACRWEGCKTYGVAKSYGSVQSKFEYLKNHLLSMHCGPKPYSCLLNECNMRFASHQALKAHMNSHVNRSSALSAADTKYSNTNDTQHDRNTQRKRKAEPNIRPPTPPPMGHCVDRRTSEFMCDTLAVIGLSLQHRQTINHKPQKNVPLLSAVKDVVRHLKQEKNESTQIQLLKSS